MPDALQQRPPIVCLWGGHRPCPDLDSHLTPSNADKGARELKARGYPIYSISPWARGRRKISGLERKLQYVACVRDLLRLARQPEAVIYTSDLPWIKLVGALKRFGLLRRRVIAYRSGTDYETESLVSFRFRSRYKRIFSAIDVIWFASENERQIWADALPSLAHRMAFHPAFIDLAYYRSIVPSSVVHDVVAIGSDSRCDWEIAIGLASAGLRVAIVTEDIDVRRRIQALPVRVRDNINLAFRSGFQQTARIAAAARCLLVATTRNFRFAGSSTLSVAVALGKPLIIDDLFELPAYGMQPGTHCETFERGSIASAQAAVHRVLSNPRYAAALGAALASRQERFSIDAFVDKLEASFQLDWNAGSALRSQTPLRLAHSSTSTSWP